MVKWGTAYPTSRRNFFLITFNWVANALVYNGLSYYSANLRVSSHLGFFISSAVEVVAGAEKQSVFTRVVLKKFEKVNF